MIFKSENTNSNRTQKGNVIALNSDNQLQVDNVIALHHHRDLNIVVLNNVSEIKATAVAEDVQMEPCVNGVCSLGWKPTKPTAA